MTTANHSAPHAAARRAAATAGCALLVSALAFGMAGCGTKAQVSIDANGVTVTDASGTQTYTLLGTSAVDQERSITVTGSDAVQVAPDMAQVSLGVNVQAGTAGETQKQAAQIVDDVRAALVASGIAEEDIATTNVYMYPRYDYSSSTEKLVGYEMNVSLSVKNLSLDGAGAAISTATDAGATSVGNVTYYCSDYDAQYQLALAKALEVADGKARAIAQANGDELGARLTVNEGYDGQVYRTAENKSFDGAVMEAAADESGGSLNVDPGTIEISASVTVEYAVSAKA